MNILLVFLINLNWDNITRPIYELFAGNDTTGMQGIVGMDPAIIGAFIFLVFLILTLMFGLGMLVGSVVIIPTLFLVFGFIPELRIIVAIICGLLFGIGLHQLIRR